MARNEEGELFWARILKIGNIVTVLLTSRSNINRESKIELSIRDPFLSGYEELAVYQ